MPSMNSAMRFCTASTLSSPLAELQPASFAALTSGVNPCPAITSPTNIDELSNAALTAWISLLHAHGGRVEHQIEARRVWWPCFHPVITKVRDHVEEVGGSRSVGVVDDDFADASFKQRDGDRPTRSARADK